MGIAEEWVVGILSVVGAAVLLWLFFGWMIRPTPSPDLWVVVQGQGDGSDLEEKLRELAWLRRAGLFRGSAVVLDYDLNQTGRELLLRLALRWSWVSCCPKGSLEEWVAEYPAQ